MRGKDEKREGLACKCLLKASVFTKNTQEREKGEVAGAGILCFNKISIKLIKDPVK